jgi:hypothetical protein
MFKSLLAAVALTIGLASAAVAHEGVHRHHHHLRHHIQPWSSPDPQPGPPSDPPDIFGSPLAAIRSIMHRQAASTPVVSRPYSGEGGRLEMEHA